MYGINESDPTGPDLGALRQLHGMLPSVAKGLVEKQAIGKGIKAKPMIQPLKPTKICEACSLLFAFQRDYEGEIQSAVCSKCEKLLEQGFTCFVSADRYAFGKSSTLADMAGRIVQITEPTMTAMEKRFEVKKKSDVNGEPPSNS